jgi:hypothetical protein
LSAASTDKDETIAARASGLGLSATRIGSAGGTRLVYGDVAEVDLQRAEVSYESAMSGS